MPNQRKKGKDFIAAWMPEDNAKALKQEAKRRGVPVSAIITSLVAKEFRPHVRKGERVMNAGTDVVETRVAGRYAARLASRVQNSIGVSAAQVISWLALVDLCRELDDALLEEDSLNSDYLALHNAILSLAIGSGTWLLHQVNLGEVDPSVCGQTRESLAASLELVRILYRTRHVEFPGSEIETVRQRIFNAAA
jgi:hypothetical protein